MSDVSGYGTGLGEIDADGGRLGDHPAFVPYRRHLAHRVDRQIGRRLHVGAVFDDRGLVGGAGLLQRQARDLPARHRVGVENDGPGARTEGPGAGPRLLTHEDDGFRELGISGSLAWQQKPSSDRGAKLSLSQTLGGSSSGGADALLSRNALDGLAANGNENGGNVLDGHRLEAKFGYGFSAFDDRFTWTPEAGIGLPDAGRDYSLGWRLVRGGSLEVSVEVRRRESANDNTASQHQVGLRVNARF